MKQLLPHIIDFSVGILFGAWVMLLILLRHWRFKESAPFASTNSDYAAAKRVWNAYRRSDQFDKREFCLWLCDRLNVTISARHGKRSRDVGGNAPVERQAIMGQRLFPDPTVDDANGGWTILYPFLRHVESLIVDNDIVGTPSLETIEAVLVAAEKALSKAAETGAQATNSASLPCNAHEVGNWCACGGNDVTLCCGSRPCLIARQA